MDKILFVDACARKESRTRQLAEYLLSFFDGEIDRMDLYQRGAFPLDENALQQREQCVSCGQCEGQSIAYARQFAEADQIVIAAPHWDLSFPAILKAYIENINVIGITFSYDEQGNPYGLCKAKKLYYVATAGGTILEDDRYGFGYVQALCRRFYGIKDIKAFYAENLDIVGQDPQKILEEAKKDIKVYCCSSMTEAGNQKNTES